MLDGGKGFTIAGITAADYKDGDKQPQREKIIDAVAAAGVKFWQDPDGHAFAMVPCKITDPDGAVKHLRVRSRKFSLVVRRLYGEANAVSGPRGTRPSSVSDSAMSEAIPAFEAIAFASDAVCVPGVRLLEKRGAIWIDLGDDTFRAIKVTAEGWSVEKRADAPLVRSEGMRALPEPVRDAKALARLRRLLNLPEDDRGGQLSPDRRMAGGSAISTRPVSHFGPGR
jgi:hypothetical protein